MKIFSAAFRPRLRTPKNIRARELDKLLKRESINLYESFNRHTRLNEDEDVTEFNRDKMNELDEIDKLL